MSDPECPAFEIPTTWGRARLVCRMAPSELGSGAILADVILESDDLADAMSDPLPDTRITVPRLVLDRAALERLRSGLEQVCEKLFRLDTEATAGETVARGRGRRPSVRIEIGRDPRFDYGFGKTGLTVRVESETFMGLYGAQTMLNWHAEVDQSCLATGIETLDGFLAAARATTEAQGERAWH